MRNLITSAGLGLAGFVAGIAMVVSCSGDSGLAGLGLETIGLDETTASAEGSEETCNSWRVRTFNIKTANGGIQTTFDTPPGEFPFAVITGASYYLFTRTCID